MKNLKEKLNNWKFIILIIVIAGGSFYWYELRPSKIRKGCVNLVEVQINRNNLGRNYIPVDERGDNNNKDFNSYYEGCLRKEGL